MLALIAFIFACIAALRYLLGFGLAWSLTTWLVVNPSGPIFHVLLFFQTLVDQMIIPAIVPLAIVALVQIQKNPEPGKRLVWASLGIFLALLIVRVLLISRIL